MGLDKMELLSATRSHLLNTELRFHPNIDTIFLYQNMRNDTVAFGGKVMYTQRPVVDPVSVYRSFWGSNETLYVQKLQLLGWAGLERAMVMTGGGNMVEFGADGEMQEEDDLVVQSSSSSEDSMDDMVLYYWTVLIAFAGALVILLLGMIYWLRTRIHIRRSSLEDWKLRSHESRQFDDAYDEEASNDTTDSESVQVQIGAQRHATRVSVRIQIKDEREVDL